LSRRAKRGQEEESSENDEDLERTSSQQTTFVPDVLHDLGKRLLVTRVDYEHTTDSGIVTRTGFSQILTAGVQKDTSADDGYDPCFFNPAEDTVYFDPITLDALLGWHEQNRTCFEGFSKVTRVAISLTEMLNKPDGKTRFEEVFFLLLSVTPNVSTVILLAADNCTHVSPWDHWMPSLNSTDFHPGSFEMRVVDTITADGTAPLMTTRRPEKETDFRPEALELNLCQPVQMVGEVLEICKQVPYQLAVTEPPTSEYIQVGVVLVRFNHS
jgi:hypothetical protein